MKNYQAIKMGMMEQHNQITGQLDKLYIEVGKKPINYTKVDRIARDIRGIASALGDMAYEADRQSRIQFEEVQ